MKPSVIIPIVISALGLLATAVGGMLWIVNETDRGQVQDRRATEGRINQRITREIKTRDKRDDRQDHRHDRHTEIIIDHEKRILRLENPNEEVMR